VINQDSIGPSDLRSRSEKPTGAGTTPIPGGAGPDPLLDLVVVTRSPGVRQDAPVPPVTPRDVISEYNSVY